MMKLCTRSSLLLFLCLTQQAAPGSSFTPPSSHFFAQPSSSTTSCKRSLGSSCSIPLLSTRATGNDDDLIVQVQAAERKVQRLNNLLTTLERRSTQDRMEWMTERTTLTRKISVLKELLKEATPPPPPQPILQEKSEPDQTETIQALELQLHMAHEQEDELLQEQDRLEREVVILQDQIVQIRNLLKTEQYRSAELEEQLDDQQEEQESQLMQYQIQVEAQAREIEAMRNKLECYEQQKQQPQPIYSSSNGSATSSSNGKAQNETMAMS